MTNIAIIGAGLSGLALARQLRTVADVTVFEKSRGPGGRIATRYADAFEFDHGAQFFTARSPAFRAFLEPLLAAGVIANWPARFAELDRDRIEGARSWSEDYPHFVGTPRMNSIGKALSSDLDVALETTIAKLVRNSDGWIVLNDEGEDVGQFDWVVLTAPAPQSQALVSGVTELASLCRARTMRGCFALMLGFEQPLELAWDAALVRNADISWMSVNSSKPGRGGAFTLLVHSTNAWADAHIEDELESVTAHMLGEASAVSGNDLTRAAHCQVHRWRYANIDKQVGPTFFIDEGKQLAACGDWFVRGRIEAAFTSAHDLGRVMRKLL